MRSGNINPSTYTAQVDTAKKVKQSVDILHKAISNMGISGDIGSNICLAFSGGKDSIVAAHIAKKYFGVSMGLCEQSFCFPKDKSDYSRIAKQLGLDITFSEILDDTWLLANKKYIFCEQSLGSKFYTLRQQEATKRYSEGNNKHSVRFTGMVTGRRNQENAIKKDFYMRKNGIMQIHPIRYWTTEDVWSFILEHNLPYPSIYATPLGLAEGATPWCNINVKKAGGIDNCWRMVYEHDKDYFINHLVPIYHEAEEWLKLEQQSK